MKGMFRHRFPLVTIAELGIFLVQQRRKIQRNPARIWIAVITFSHRGWRVQISRLLQVPMLPCNRVYLNSLKILGFFLLNWVTFWERSNLSGFAGWCIGPSGACDLFYLWWLDTPYSLQVPKQLELCIWWHLPETWCSWHVFLGGF